MNYGQAFLALKAGDKVARPSWTDTHLILVDGVNPFWIRPRIDEVSAAGQFAWLATPEDVAADDWIVVV